jgi:tetratricopeptide (TPR) repeat protein
LEETNNISQELLETIERYLKNEMDTDERIAFEKQLEEDPALRRQVEDTELLFSGIKKAAFKNKLEGIHEDLIQKEAPELSTPKVFKLNFRKLSIAASILILVGGFWFFNQQPRNEKLFYQYFEPDRGLATTMSETDNYPFNDAMVDYKNTKYELAIPKWEFLLQSKPENDTLNYFLGVAELANANELKAIDYLKKVVENKKGDFTNDAYYYLGLAYLKVDDTEAAIENLKKNDSPKSKKIISEIKK